MEHFSRLSAVMAREFRWLFTNRPAFCALLFIPVITLSVLTWTFSKSTIHNLNVAVVDMDRSDISRTIAQSVSASSTVTFNHSYRDLASASAAIRNGEIDAAVYIAPLFEKELTGGMRPQIVVLYNNQFLTVGTAVSNALGRTINTAISSESGLSSGTNVPLPTAGPVVVSEGVFGNTTTNYAEFLARAVGPTVLHIMITIITTFSMASEFCRKGGLAELLEVAGNRPVLAMVGKGMPLLLIGFALMLGLTAVQNVTYGLTIKGSITAILASAILLIVAYQGLGFILALALKDRTLSLSISSILVSPAFSYAGIGFPVSSMNTFAQTWSSILPLRWYLHIFFDQATRGVSVHSSMWAILILFWLALLYYFIAWLLFSSIVRSKTGLVFNSETVIVGPCGPSVFSVFRAEARRITSNRSVFSFFIIGSLFYGVFYPQPYLGEIVRKVPIAVLDHDNNAMSQQLVMALDASEAISVKMRVSSFAAAEEALKEGKVFAVIEIPEEMTRNVLRGISSSLPTYVDGTYFIVRGKTLGGITSAVLANNADRISANGREDSSLAKFSKAKISPAELLEVPLYNPTGGYAAYVVPAAFVLILQQIMFFGAAGLSPIFPVSDGNRRSSFKSAITGLVGQTLAQSVMMIPSTLFLLVIMVRVYGFSTLGQPLDLALMILPFLLSTSLMAQAFGYWFKDRSTPLVLFVAVSLPLFFLTGASWPLESIPVPLQYISRLIPSTVAIDGIVRVSQMGAGLAGVLNNWKILWSLAVLYFFLAAIPRVILGKPAEHEV